MPRDIPVGNGNLLVAFDKNGILREFFYPHVGEENHTQGEPFRFGVFVNDSFSWIPEGWEVSRNYLDDSLVTDVEFKNDSIGLKILSNDLVDFNENIYLKKITLENQSEEPRDGTLFIGQDFHIYGTNIGDTAAFKPEVNGLLHYKGERYFLANIYANKKFGIDLYSTGKKETDPYLGTWKDAEDGRLDGNPIAQGSVDSVLGIPFQLPGKGTDTFYYWIAAGKNWEEVAALNQLIRMKTPEVIFKRTFDYWKLWVDKEKLNYSLLPDKIARLYKRSLLVCRTQINNSGSIIASNDSDSIDFNKDTYSYMWPRDGSFIAYALDLAGYDFTQKFFEFCARLITKDGYFLHKYTPTGSLASSWHPWVQEENRKKLQLPIQEDETALVIWALWNHYQVFRDIECLMPLYHSLVKKGADFLMEYRDMKTGLPLPSYDLWEERYGIFTYTVSTVYGGLMAASRFADAFGETTTAEEYRQGAAYMREAMDKHLYLENENRFARSIEFQKDGSKKIDASIDASLYAIFAFGAYPADDPKVKSTMDQIVEKLWHPDGGGLARYENDPYYRNHAEGRGNPWFVTTLWLAQYKIALAKTEQDLKEALGILEWIADHALPSGILAEQVNPSTNEPISVSPLTWSHGNFIAAVQEYLNKLLKIEKCPHCNLPKCSKTRQRDEKK